MPKDSFSILYDPGVYRSKIKISFVSGQGLTIQTEKPMSFADAIQKDFVSYDFFLYERKVEESNAIAKMISELQNSDFYAILNSSEAYQTRRDTKIVLSIYDDGFHFELTLRSPELSENPKIKRIHGILLELFDCIGMAEWYNFDTRRKEK